MYGDSCAWGLVGKQSITLSGMERFCNQTSKPITHDLRDLEGPAFSCLSVWDTGFLKTRCSEGPGKSGWLFSVFQGKMGVRTSKLPPCQAGKSYTWLFIPPWCLISLHLQVHANIPLMFHSLSTEQSFVVLLCHILFSHFLCDKFPKFFSMFRDYPKSTSV